MNPIGTLSTQSSVQAYEEPSTCHSPCKGHSSQLEMSSKEETADDNGVHCAASARAAFTVTQDEERYAKTAF